MKALIQERRTGYTLVEMTITIAVMTVLLGGLTSAVMLASHALPDRNNQMIAVTDAAELVAQISSEIYSAVSVTNRKPNSFRFTVPDRNSDGNPELIRYQWSGTPGEPLTRKYNTSTETTVAPAVYDFNVNYHVDVITKTEDQEITTYSDEQLLAFFENWPELIPDVMQQPVDNDSWVSQYFEVTPPENTIELVITRAKIKLQSLLLPSSPIKVGIHRSMLDGSYAPEENPIGPDAVIPSGSLDINPLWIEATFANVVVSDPLRKDYCLVLAGVTSDVAMAEYLFHNSAPPNDTVMKWTGDGGLTWLPAAQDIDKNDLLFYVYGKFASTTTVPIPVDRYFLKSIDLSLQLNDDPLSSVSTSVQVINTPEVTP